jgi:hypothetical protein
VKSLQRRRAQFAVEALEERCTPATSGIAWPNGQQMTLSFVPDGTKVDGYFSSLFKTLNSQTSTAAWEREILRAFQSWAQYANLNVGVVSDGGQPLGTAGAVQGDSRFGDIRVAAAPLASGTLITNTSFQWSGTTWSGDVVVNSNYLFNVGGTGGAYDLYTAMLDEAGNVFGVLDSKTDIASAAYYQYVGVKTGLDANDIADIQSVYGARAPDAFDANHVNNTISNASPLPNDPTKLNLTADITTQGDVDYYKVTAPALAVSFSATLKTSGVSALQGKVQVFDANGQLLGSASATDPLGGNVAVNIFPVLTGKTYYVAVSSSAAVGSPFAVGGYNLSIVDTFVSGLTNAIPTNLLAGPTLDLHTNDSIQKATTLPSPTGMNGQTTNVGFFYQGAIEDPVDVDYYKVQNSGNTYAWNMNVLVWALPGSPLLPNVAVFDQKGNPVKFQVLNNVGGAFALEIPSVLKGATFFVEVAAQYSAGSHGTGGYALGVDFNTTTPTAVADITSGTLNSTTNALAQSFTVGQNRLYNFLLSTSGGTAGTEVRMDIRDANNNLVFSLLNYAGMPTATGQVYLAAGSYTITYSAINAPGSQFQPTSFDLSEQVISDPIGPAYTGGTKDALGTTHSTSSGSSYTNPYYL